MALRESISEASKTNLLQTASFSTNKTSEKTGKFSCGKSEAPGTGKANNDQCFCFFLFFFAVEWPSH